MEARGKKHNYQNDPDVGERDEASYGNSSEIKSQFTLKF
jgi:hypothetical protein